MGQVNKAENLISHWGSKHWLGFICLPDDGPPVLS